MKLPPMLGRTTYFVDNRSSQHLIIEIQHNGSFKRIPVPRGKLSPVGVDSVLGSDPRPQDSFKTIRVLCAVLPAEQAQLLWEPRIDDWQGGRIDTEGYGESEYTLLITDAQVGPPPDRSEEHR